MAWHRCTHPSFLLAPADSPSGLCRDLWEAERLVVLSEVASCSVKHHLSDGGGAAFFNASVASPLPLHSCISEILFPSNALALKPCLVLRFQGNLWTTLSRLFCQCLLDDVGKMQGPNGRQKRRREKKPRYPLVPTSGGILGAVVTSPWVPLAQGEDDSCWWWPLRCPGHPPSLL